MVVLLVLVLVHFIIVIVLIAQSVFLIIDYVDILVIVRHCQVFPDLEFDVFPFVQRAKVAGLVHNSWIAVPRLPRRVPQLGERVQMAFQHQLRI